MISQDDLKGGEIVYAIPASGGIYYCYEESSALGWMKEGKFKDPMDVNKSYYKDQMQMFKKKIREPKRTKRFHRDLNGNFS